MSALVPIPINPPPGVVVTESNRVAEGRWTLPFDKERFVHGRPQKIGGNIRVTSTAMSGTPRATLCWQDFNANGYVACGTYRKLYAFDSSFALNDITPFRATGTLGSNPFTSTAGSSSVTVNQSGHSVNPGDTVIFSGAFPAGTPSLYGGWSTSGNFWVNPSTEANLAAYITAANYTFTRATSATFVNSSGNLATASTGVQRIDYDPVALTAKGTLLEGASTNSILQSNTFSNASWTVIAGSIAQNVTGPDGSSNTGWTGTSSGSGAQFTQSVTPGTSHVTLSVFAKAGTSNWVFIGFQDTGGAGNAFVSFNVSTGAVGTSNWTSGSPVGRFTNPIITKYANGWYRVSAQWSLTTPQLVIIGASDSDASGAMSNGHTALFYGAQMETGVFPFATSYIATTTGSVTRNADRLTRTRTSPTSLTKLITAFMPLAVNPNGSVLWSANDGTTNNYIDVTTNSGHIQVAVVNGGVLQCNIDLGAVAAGAQFTIAVAFSSTVAASLNGGAVSSQSISLPAGLTTETLGWAFSAGFEWFADVTSDAEWTGIIASNAALQTLSSSPNLNGPNIPSWLPYIGGAQNMNGTFICATVIDTSNYTVTTSTTATDSESYGGNAVAYEYEISVGTELGAFGQGWGVGPWGLGTWGTARAGGIFQEPRVWSLDHFGQVLVATYNGGSIWFFDPTQSQPYGRALATYRGNTVNGAPTNCRYAFVTPERFIFALSANMVVNVCSQGDPTTWTPATTNTAFARTLQIGTKLVAGRVLAPFISMVWSDNAAYLFQYTGSQFIYNSSVAGVDCGLISPNAAVTVDGFAYWMGPDNFYFYNGTVGPMPNVEDIRKYVFEAIPSNVSFQVAAIYVPKYHEIWWFYPAGAGATNPTNYVIYHINDQCWSVGTANFFSSTGITAGRASGSHFTQGDTSPVMAGTDGYLYNHDGVTLTYDDNGNPLTWTLTLGPLAMNEGLQNAEIEGIVWDFFGQVGDISSTVNMFDRLTDPAPIDTDTENVPASQAGIVDYRVHGRYAGLSLTQSVLGGYMRIGKPVLFAKPAGTRR